MPINPNTGEYDEDYDDFESPPVIPATLEDFITYNPEFYADSKNFFTKETIFYLFDARNVERDVEKRNKLVMELMRESWLLQEKSPVLTS